MGIATVECQIAGRTLSLETGRLAKQSHGAILARYADTVVLASVLSGPPREGIDYFPLYVDYREMQYAAGKVPGGFFKREGRPSSKEILTCRLIDRPIRPLFPDDYYDEVQIQCIVLSTDQENDPDMVAVIASSAALAISPTPFQGPIGAVRVGLVKGQLVINPTHTELAESQMDLIVCGHADAVNMLELGGKEVSEEIAAAGVEQGFAVCRQIVDMINQLVAKVGVVKSYEAHPLPDGLLDRVRSQCGEGIRQAKHIPGKIERNQVMDSLREQLLAELCPDDAEEYTYAPDQVKYAFYKVEGQIQRELILAGRRPDGRRSDEVRALGIDVGVLPRTHGSSLFSRGETQALVTTTLGTPRDEQIIDGLQEEFSKKFMLHYNFPPFSVGEIKPIRGPGRREIGHGALAEKSLEGVLPLEADFPYTIRVVSDILESNGSTSMATVCGGTLAMMDAGVPLKGPVAGISIGMVSEGDRYVLLTDIMGEEDFHGDMDFKVAGTAKGITGIQLDLKARGITQKQIVEAFQQALKARLFILGEMTKVLSASRTEINQYAPRMLLIKIDPEKIGKVIGPGGKTINKIQSETGATIDIEDDGRIFVACIEAKGAEAARDAIMGLTEDVEVGRIYTGKVVSIRDFGAFIEILPGKDGLCHVSELDEKYVKKPTDVVNLGDTVTVKVISIDDQGRVKLSRKAVLKEKDGKV
jgi:polyribonucleotide nucleotidyltransferase